MGFFIHRDQTMNPWVMEGGEMEPENHNMVRSHNNNNNQTESSLINIRKK